LPPYSRDFDQREGTPILIDVGPDTLNLDPSGWHMISAEQTIVASTGVDYVLDQLHHKLAAITIKRVSRKSAQRFK
jgi:hypothetical protein